MGSMSISIDGLEEEHTYLRRNPSSFKTVVQAIDLMMGEWNRTGGRFLFDVITCVHRKNLENLPALRDFLIEKGVPAWRIFSIFPSGRAAAGEAKEDLSLT